MTQPAPRWTWQQQGESGGSLECWLEISGDVLKWEVGPDHDIRQPGQSLHQTIESFIAYGPPEFGASESILRQIVAHLGLPSPHWLLPLSPAAEVLHRAAEKSDLQAMQAALATGLPVDTPDRQGRTALWLAVETRQRAAAELLLAHGAAGGASSRSGWTALMSAAAQGDLLLVRALLAHGAEPKALLHGSVTALSLAWSSAEVCQELLAAGAESLTEALAEAVSRGAPAVARLLLAHGADVNAVSNRGLSAFQASLQQGKSTALAEELLAAGGDLRQPFPGKLTWLHAAARHGDEALPLLRAALAAGVPLEERDRDGKTALLHALPNPRGEATVRALLVAGADLGAEDRSHQTALKLVASRGPESSLRLLLARGIDWQTGTRERTPVFLALSAWAPAALLEECLQAGASPHCASHGFQPLHQVAASGTVEAAAVLLKYGADVNAVAPGGLEKHTPLWYARDRKREAMCAFLQAHGALG